MSLPEGWAQQTRAFGLSDEEKKIFGVTLTAPFDPSASEGSAPRMSAHYYAPDNLMDKTAEKYIRVHTSPVPVGVHVFPALPEVKDGQFQGLLTEIFSNMTHERGPERRIDAKGIELWESFVVITPKEGYYALRYSAPKDRYAAGLPAFEAFIASFKPLLR
ncbi:MAG: hypothetical protein WC943_06995 [Elusimicrobiota bacterium]